MAIKNNPKIVLQFHIELLEIEPFVWRCIQVPAKYNFWDLHVAIQDAMGWLDYHLHAFRVKLPRKKKIIEIGIPIEEEYYDEPTTPGWEILITDYFKEPGNLAPYMYDFGDGWHHDVLLEGILLKDKDAKYPRCIAGERACPPEDCGGVLGYYELIDVLKNSKHPDYQGHVEWLKSHAKNYHPYNPDYFDPEEVEFSNPKERWKMAFT
jgi:hypothetical protein